MRGFLFVLAVLGGCSTDTFTGGDAAGDDGGGTSDGGGVADASTFDVASCGPKWCATQALSNNGSCTDFDESTSLPLVWTLETSRGGAVSLSSSPADQCLSLHSQMPVQTQAAGAATADLTRSVTLAGTPTSIHATLDLDVRLPKSVPGGTVYVFGIHAGNTTFGLAQHPDGTWFLQPTGNPNAAVPVASQGPVVEAFTHMTLDVTFSASSITAQLKYQRSDNQGDTIVANTGAVTVPTTVSFVVGIEVFSTTGAVVDTYYDNVLTSVQ